MSDIAISRNQATTIPYYELQVYQDADIPAGSKAWFVVSVDGESKFFDMHSLARAMITCEMTLGDEARIQAVRFDPTPLWRTANIPISPSLLISYIWKTLA